MTTVYKFKSYFTKSGVGAAPGTAPTVDVVNTDTDAKLVTAGSATTLTNLTGYYEYEYSGADNLDLVGLFHATDTTMDQADMVSFTPERYYQYLNASISTVSTNVSDILTDTGTTLPALIATSGLGAGGIPKTYTQYDATGTAGLADVSVWVTSGTVSSTGILASGITNANGQVTFMLDAGTVYVWRQKSGWDFANPDTEVVS